MRIQTICFAILLATPALPAVAQSSTPSPDAHKVSGGSPAGDPNGAIRSLSKADDGGPGSRQIVKVPDLGGEAPERTGGVPRGTTGPGAR